MLKVQQKSVPSNINSLKLLLNEEYFKASVIKTAEHHDRWYRLSDEECKNSGPYRRSILFVPLSVTVKPDRKGNTSPRRKCSGTFSVVRQIDQRMYTVDCQSVGSVTHRQQLPKSRQLNLYLPRKPCFSCRKRSVEVIGQSSNSSLDILTFTRQDCIQNLSL